MATFINNDEYEIPLRDQRYFGAGIKRKRIQFVPSTSSVESVSLPTTPSTSVADKYRDVVLKKRVSAERASEPPVETIGHASQGVVDDAAPEERADPEQVETTCEICHRPIASSDPISAHQSSIAHQICLQHSYPPSHLNRRRKGLAVLESQGWDPDSRRGLGAEGEGILHPIKAKENPDRAGIGVKPEILKVVQRPVRLDAGKVSLMEKAGKKKAERLREAFYRSEDVVKYLGE